MDEIDKLIEWSAVVKLLDGIYGSDEGLPSYPLLTYVKLLLLQQWYGLSDPRLEEAVDDRLSFRRFANESVPDHSTIWRFRQALAAHGLAEALFEEINRQLDARGLIVRQGTLIDATLLQASVKPPSVKEGTVSERDPAPPARRCTRLVRVAPRRPGPSSHYLDKPPDRISGQQGGPGFDRRHAPKWVRIQPALTLIRSSHVGVPFERHAGKCPP